MATFTPHQIENFFKKSEKFFNSHYPILHHDNGLLTKLVGNEGCSGKITYSLIHAIDRHRLIGTITQDLIKIMCFESEEANELAFYYVDLKYKEYCDYMMNL